MSDEFNNINNNTEASTSSFIENDNPEDLSSASENAPFSVASSSTEKTTGSGSVDFNTTTEGFHFSTAPEKARKKKNSSRKVAAVAAVCLFAGGVAGAGLTSIWGHTSASAEGISSSTVIHQAATQHAAVLLENVASGTVLSDSEIYAQNVNSTVGITTSITTNYWGYTTEAAASGSGFIISSDGYILTNYHVVEDSNSISVTMYDNSHYDATLIGYDEDNDIAVLKIEATDLTPVTLGDSDALLVGDHVVAIGNPLGELTFSLTQGAVSALNRQVTFSSGVRMALIQTDAAINSGNSGGALFNCYGEVIGITNAKYGNSSSSASVDNLGFAIPINSVKTIFTSIIEKGYVEKPYIGVTILTVSENVQAYGLPAGVSIQSVSEGSPAESAGLQVNDIITEANGNEMTSSSDLTAYVSKQTPGTEMELKVYREGNYITVNVTIGVRQSSANEEKEAEEKEAGTSQQYSNGYGYSFPGMGGSSGGFGGFGGFGY